MADSINNCAKTIDSRDIIERIEELRGELDGLINEVTDAEDAEDKQAALDHLADWMGCAADTLPDDLADLADLRKYGYDESDKAMELASLEDLQSQCNYGDWRYGAQLIQDAYFEEYAEELASEIGAIDRNAKWPLSHIDWKAAADELKQDYAMVSFDGTDYWLRA